LAGFAVDLTRRRKAQADFGNPRQIKNLKATGLILATCLAIHELLHTYRTQLPEDAFFERSVGDVSDADYAL
jgi:hypothetical protein